MHHHSCWSWMAGPDPAPVVPEEGAPEVEVLVEAVLAEAVQAEEALAVVANPGVHS